MLMYNKLNITENHLRILVLFSGNSEQDYYIREISSILKISPRTSQLILQDLEKKGILESKIRGKIKIYKITKEERTQKYLQLAKDYQNLLTK
jgi:uncharacterized protein